MKRLTFICAICLFSFVGISQNSQISGVVSYFYNDDQGDKPDIGATVYLLNSLKVLDLNYETYDSLSHSCISLNKARAYGKISDEYGLKGNSKWKEYEKMANEAYESGKQFGVKRINEIDKNFNSMLNKSNITQFPNRNVDGAGNYSFLNVPNGVYYVCIISKGRKGNLLSNAEGKIYLKKVAVKENETINVNCNFDIYSL